MLMTKVAVKLVICSHLCFEDLVMIVIRQVYLNMNLSGAQNKGESEFVDILINSPRCSELGYNVELWI